MLLRVGVAGVLLAAGLLAGDIMARRENQGPVREAQGYATGMLLIGGTAALVYVALAAGWWVLPALSIL